MVSISVIMPLYNAEKYLEDSLQSILKQTYENFEIICINDASTDATLEILRRFQIADSRIRILENRERSGPAISRNRGIYEAKGKFVTFLDGDDIFDEEMLELAYKEIEKHDVDIVMYEYMHVPSSCIYEKKCVSRSVRFVERYCNSPFSVMERDPIEYKEWTSSPCNKLYRKSFILEKDLEFQTLSSCNDVYFVEMALLLAGKIIMLNDRRVMVYARDHEALTRISHDRDPMCAYCAIEKMGKELVRRNVFGVAQQHYYCIAAYCLMGTVFGVKDIKRAEAFYSFLQNEGIENLLRLRLNCSQKIDEYIYILLENFRKKDIQTKWYKETSDFKYYLYKCSEKILTLFRSHAAEGICVYVWGIGRNGRNVLEFLQQHNIKDAVAVDSDKRKQGECVYGYVIKAPEEVFRNMQIVVVCSSGVYKEIVPGLEERNIKVVNIEELIGIG